VIYFTSEADIFMNLPLIINHNKFELNTSCSYWDTSFRKAMLCRSHSSALSQSEFCHFI